MIAPNGTPPIPRTGFLAVLRASGLLAEPQFLRAVSALPADAQTGREAAQALVAAGVLTRFQADRLLAGRADGFVIGQYVILDQVARGPTGRVYKALHRAMNRPVAIRMLPADQTRGPGRRAALLAEARSAARLAHPNVVTVLDANQHGDRFYLVLEHVDGSGAEAAVRKSGPLPVARACEVARQAALGLQHAHEKEVCHGALSPGCLLVGRPAVKVANFGLGRAGGTADDPADYLAPELSDSRAAPTPKSDLYAFGGVLYFLLTGRTPFPGLATEDKARHHAESEPVPVESLRPEVPPAVAGLVRELMAKDPADRPASAADVAARLDPFGESAGAASWGEIYIPGSGRILVPPPRDALVTTPAPSGTLVDTAAHPTLEVLSAVADTSPWAGLGAATLDAAGPTEVPCCNQPAGPAGRRLVAIAVLVAALAVIATVAAVLSWWGGSSGASPRRPTGARRQVGRRPQSRA
jgi:serine/threonine-protein kinase